MENFLSDMDLKNLMKELGQGRELAKQLHDHMLHSSSREIGEVLLNEILNSLDQALFLINHSRRGLAAVVMPDPLDGSPPTDISDHESKDRANTKRRWRKKVEVCGETGIEGQLDDGYGWRKYGQKDILGAKYPRGYYRCTNRYGQNCLATKQIQRSDSEPNTLDITYCGIHTCNPVGNPCPGDPPTPITTNPQNQLGNPQPLSLECALESEDGGLVATSSTSVANSSALDVDFPLDISYEFWSNFSFEDHRE